MKKIKSYMGAILFSLLSVFTSCVPTMDYFNPEAETIDTYYNTKEHLIYAVNGAYNVIQLLQSWGRNMPYILNTRSDEAVFTFKAAAGDPTVVQLSGYTISAGHQLVSEIYSNFYTLQFTANLALEKLEENQDDAFDLNDPEDKALYDRLMGEAYFLRAFSRFYITSLWGGGDGFRVRVFCAKGKYDFFGGPVEKGVSF
ncbi:MAG: RagB/SusD family nutrient uptake outer membrane protein, partial [Bacteroides sp.]|nr:RagB/SusD family nutrient uptake outer membrane protein [Bacteroides sp.]